VVQSGDTVSRIAERHGMRSAELRELNDLSGDNIRVGQRLRVSGSGRARDGADGASAAPPGAEQAPPRQPAAASGAGVYVVQSGDTVSQIAERHGMRSAELRSLNDLSGDNIRVGQRLRVSGAGAPAAPRGEDPSARAPASRAAPSAPQGQIPLNAPPPRQPAAAPAAPRASSGASQGGGSVYVVQSGDTVSQIAERHGMRSSELRELNDLSGDSIRVGQKLRVSGSSRRAAPASGASRQSGGGSTYKVQDGDTLYSIARKHGLSVDELRRLNGKSGDIVRPGETVKVK
jgi:LysM repeat protein